MIYNRLILIIFMMMSSFIGAADEPILAAAQSHPRFVRDYSGGGHEKSVSQPEFNKVGWNETLSPGGPVDFFYLDTKQNFIYIAILDKISDQVLSLIIIGPDTKVKLSGFYKLIYKASYNKSFPAYLVPYLIKACFVGDREDNTFNLPLQCSGVVVTTIK